MSVAAIYTHGNQHLAPNHDQLDDLESFYYVLYDMVCSWEGVGALVKELPEAVSYWHKIVPLSKMSMTKKLHFMSNEPELDCIPEYWLPAVKELVVGFYTVVRELFLAKCNIRWLEKDTKREELRALLSTADACYAKVLALFDKALDALISEESGSSHDISHSPPRPTLHRSPPASSSKRKPDPANTDRAPKKRRRVEAPPNYSPPRTRSQTKAALLESRMPHHSRAQAYTPPRTRSKSKAAASRADPTHRNIRRHGNEGGRKARGA